MPNSTVYKSLAEIQDFSDDEKFGPHGGFTAIASTETKDRDGENVYHDEWDVPLPDHITIDSDHGMSLATTVGSAHPYFNEQGQLMIDAKFSSIARAQEARTLVKEKHIRTVSVAFLRRKNEKSGKPRRELLNVGLVAIPANPEAVILDSKALDIRAEEIAQERLETKAPKPYGDVTYADPEEGKYPIDTVAHIRAALAYIGMPRNRAALGDHLAHVEAAIHAAARAHGIDVSKSVDEAETKAPQGQSAGSGDRAMLQAIHDASVHMGAVCVIPMITDEDDTGAADGANKSTDEVETKNADDEELIEAIEVPEDSPLGQTLAAFEQKLDEVLTPEESPTDSPAEAAAASDEEPAPADEAADDVADELASRAQALDLQLSLLT